MRIVCEDGLCDNTKFILDDGTDITDELKVAEVEMKLLPRELAIIKLTLLVEKIDINKGNLIE